MRHTNVCVYKYIYIYVKTLYTPATSYPIGCSQSLLLLKRPQIILIVSYLKNYLIVHLCLATFLSNEFHRLRSSMDGLVPHTRRQTI